MSRAETLPPLREVIKKYGLSANKALGQNFLLDEQLLDRIAAIPGKLDGQNVLEIGPGPGGLTRALLRAGANVAAVEQDARCLPALDELGGYFSGKLQIIEGDALKIDASSQIGGRYHIISNLPYNVGSQLLVNWLSAKTWPPQWLSLTLMFQREVAERIIAQPGTKDYGRLSVLAQWRCQAKLAMKVHRSAFTPPPKVMSAVVHIVPKEQPEGVESEALERLTQAAFGQRRKMLRQSLKVLPGGLEALDRLGIDPTGRPETVSVDEWVALAQSI